MKDTPCLSGLPTSWWWWRWWWRWWWWGWWRWRWRCGHLLSERASYKLVVNSHLWSDCEYIVIFPSYLFTCLRELPMFDWLSLQSRGEWWCQELQCAIKILHNSNNCRVIQVRRGKVICSDSQCWEREGKGRGQIILCIFWPRMDMNKMCKVEFDA